MHNRYITLLLLTLLLGLYSASAQPITAEPEGPHVVEIEFESREQLADLAARLDVWEVDHDAGTLIALVTPDERAALESAGYGVQTEPTLSAHPDTIPGYPCYRTIDEIYTQIAAWEVEYPDIAQLSTIGYSYEGRPLKVMRLTRRSLGGEKPIFFLMANIHGRELITNETVMVYIQYLLENYDSDPDVTWLLNEHEVYVLLSANPDGHVKNEPGEPWAWWRKNTHPYGSCSSDSYGVDLNRNHSFKWGCCGGSSGDPCATTYRGPYHASESETQVVQDYVRTLFPDQRGPGDYDAAPQDATGVLITLHSYSNLVLWPWGHTSTPAPNSDGLSALGRKMATYNNYIPQQASGLYTVDGSTDDWSYGELGIASYTFEIGSGADGFYPPCNRYDALIQPNISALLYAAKVARTPYITSFGPDALQLTVTPNPALVGESLSVQATVNDEDNGAATIVAAEAYVGTPSWDGGVPYALTATDSDFDETVEGVHGQIETAGLTEGRHLVYVRGKDSTGHWGPLSAAFVELAEDSAIAGTVTDRDTHAPLPGAAISARSTDRVYSTTSAGDGGYLLPVRAGTYTVTTTHFGYAPQHTVLTATTGTTTSHNFSLPRLPWGRLSLIVDELGTGLPLTATIEVTGSPFSLTEQHSATLELPVGNYTVTASTDFGHETRSEILTLTAGTHTTHVFRLPPPPPLLVVDDDGGETYETFLLPLLDALLIPYHLWEIESQGVPPATKLARYEGLIWFTGNDGLNSLNVSEQAAITTYLNEGRRLLLTGQNLGRDISNDPGHFYRNILRATFVQDDAGDRVGVVGLHLYATLADELWNGTGANNQSSPDVIAPYDASATEVFTYTTGGTAGIAVERGGYRLIYLSYGLEGVASTHVRQEIVRRSLEWLGVDRPPGQLRFQVANDKIPIPVGETTVYSLELLNDSLIPLSEGALTISYPMSNTLLSATPQPTAVEDNQARWDDLSLASEESILFSWKLRLRYDYMGESITHTLTVSWPEMSSQPSWSEVTPVLATGVVLLPTTNIQRGIPGTTLTYTLAMTNTDTLTTTYDVVLAGNHWPTNIPSNTVGPLAPSEGTNVTLFLEIPPDARPGEYDEVTVTVTAQDDLEKTTSATLKGSVLWQLYLPIILRLPAP